MVINLFRFQDWQCKIGLFEAYFLRVLYSRFLALMTHEIVVMLVIYFCLKLNSFLNRFKGSTWVRFLRHSASMAHEAGNFTRYEALHLSEVYEGKLLLLFPSLWVMTSYFYRFKNNNEEKLLSKVFVIFWVDHSRSRRLV